MSCSCSAKLGQHKKKFIIKHPRTGMVLDATDYPVRLQPFNGTRAQLWTLECGYYGRFAVVNKGNGKLLNVAGGVSNDSKVITFGRASSHLGLNEQWFIPGDRTIASAAAGELCLHIPNYSPGTTILVSKRNGMDSQEFRIEYK